MFWYGFVQDLSCETSDEPSNMIQLMTVNAFGASMPLRAWFLVLVVTHTFPLTSISEIQNLQSHLGSVTKFKTKSDFWTTVTVTNGSDNSILAMCRTLANADTNNKRMIMQQSASSWPCTFAEYTQFIFQWKSSIFRGDTAQLMFRFALSDLRVFLWNLRIFEYRFFRCA